ncbi:MAG: hypothetical protein P8075_12865 [Deltaproteobacteria bacterium]
MKEKHVPKQVRQQTVCAVVPPAAGECFADFGSNVVEDIFTPWTG